MNGKRGQRCRNDVTNAERCRAIFEDTEIPKNAEDAFWKYASTFRYYSVRSEYLELAEKILIENGCEVNSKNRVDELHRIFANYKNPRILEAHRLRVFFNVGLFYKCRLLKLLRSLQVSASSTRKVQRIARAIEEVEKIHLEIGALGERIKARSSEADALRGKQARKYCRQGHEQAYGTPSEKAARWGSYQAELDRVWRPGMSHARVAMEIAPKFGKSCKTITRRTSLPSAAQK